MNIKDIALLKYIKIFREILLFLKGLRQEEPPGLNQKSISAYITEDMKRIVARWSLNSSAPENYIFPILDPNGDADRQRAQIQQFTQVINDWMKVIASKLGIEKKLQLYSTSFIFNCIKTFRSQYRIYF